MTLDEPQFTLGIEEEYLLVDKETRSLVIDPPKSLLSECKELLGNQVTNELLRSQIEIGTKVCNNIQEAREDLAKLRKHVIKVTGQHGIDPVVISIHSFTPVINGEDRKWEIGVLWDKDPVTAEIFLTRLVEAGYLVGDNEPYSGKAPEDFTIDYHAESTGLPHVGIEISQDLINHSDGGKLISDILQEIISLITTKNRSKKH